MFGWLKWGKSVHPLADVKAAQQLIAGLPGHDPARALDKVAAWLDSINRTREINLQQRWEVIDLLDKGVIAHRRKLAQDMAAPRLQKVDDRLWTASFGFWKTLGSGYQRCIETAKMRPAEAEAVRKNLPLIAARAVRAAHRQLSLTFLRHEQIEERIWRELGSAYLFAESHGFAAQRVELYPEPQSQSSAQEELLESLMLAMASPHNLAAAKLRIAERVVAHFGGRFVLHSEPVPGCGFYFDLALTNPPARRRKEMAASPTVRYFGAGEAERGLSDLMREVRARDGVPSDVNLGGDFDQDTVVSVLAHLARFWDSAAPERRDERTEVVTRVTVVPGFPNILRCLELLASGATLDPASFAEQESWIAVDRSEGGYGVLVPKERDSFDYDPLTGARTGSGDWLRIGSLVALGEENATAWKLGIVRRIRHEASGQRHVGIEVLEGLAIVIRLSAASGPRTGEPERRRSAVLLSRATDRNDEALVLMRAGHFMKTQTLNADLGGQRYLLLPSELIEGGEDFDCARFKVVPA
jgi:hypothetical protein